MYPPCGCTEQQGPPCLAADDNDDEDDDYNGDENDMNGGLSYTCTVELKNMIMALRISRVMEKR